MVSRGFDLDSDLDDECDIEPMDDLLDSGSDVPLDMESNFQIETDLQIADAADALSSIDATTPDFWDALDTDARLEALQEMELRMAEVQDRPAVPVHVEDLPPGQAGGFNGSEIVVNSEHLASDMHVDEFIDTIVHEGRHAYQDHAVRTPGFVIDEVTVESWRDNMANYLSAEDYGQEIYLAQPIEADAWNYAGRVTDGIRRRRGGA